MSRKYRKPPVIKPSEPVIQPVEEYPQKVIRLIVLASVMGIVATILFIKSIIEVGIICWLCSVALFTLGATSK